MDNKGGIYINRYLAHSPTDAHPEGQALKSHLENVSRLCEGFCVDFAAEIDGRLCGLYHDIGKYSLSFQRRLQGSRESVDHSSAGALLLFDKGNHPAAICIAGHHTGLADLGTKHDLADTFMGRINCARKGRIDDCSAWRHEIPDTISTKSTSGSGLDIFFYTKMLFSALTDADWLDTEAYFQDRPPFVSIPDLAALKEKLTAYIAPWWAAKSEINLRRCSILCASIQRGKEKPGLFTMTVPTGGGKTVSSMAFALHHAIEHGMKRIIYVIPYCSILEQTQDVFEEIFGKDNITAHYSGADFSSRDGQEEIRTFSAENWEAPIILTTAVQFFESVYSNKPGKNRKLHNITQSVLIFDEAQMLPVPFLRPCLAAICKLVEKYGCSAVLCTATQPAVETLLSDYLPNQPVRELCPAPKETYQAFRRVRYVDDGDLSDEDLVRMLRDRRQVLCVVNSRRQAQLLYHMLNEGNGCYHLSTMMTPYDRRRVLQEIKARLHEGQDCRVISTSLIEAGVDVDFPEVFRALAGLDSIIQSGGRCNREGKRPAETSLVHVFRTEAKAPDMLEQNIGAAARILRDYEQIDSPEAIHSYFQFLFFLKGDRQLDSKEILRHAGSLRFKTVSEAFKLIDGADDTIYVPVGPGTELIQELRQRPYGPDRDLLRQLGPYGVNVYHWVFSRFCEIGAVEPISENAGILVQPDLYSRRTGLTLTVSEQNQGIFI